MPHPCLERARKAGYDEIRAGQPRRIILLLMHADRAVPPRIDDDQADWVETAGRISRHRKDSVNVPIRRMQIGETVES
jgi:hypothetical protein